MREAFLNLTTLLGVGLALILVVAWLWPWLGGGVFARIESWGSRLGSHRVGSILCVTMLVIVLRLSVLKSVKVPVPQVHDEFSYLLAGDTFAHGRLTNPPHPMWIFFETFHVNQLPTYSSKYPPGQGAVLALGEVLGNPWIGVLLSMACFCGVLTWALQGWFPARWAFLGGILSATQFGPLHYWINSYWGGAVAAIGGALVIGAYPRIVRHQRVRDSVLFAAGIGILGNSRPYEGAIFTLIFVAALAWVLVRRPKTDCYKTFTHVVIPMSLVLILVAAFLGYYNWRVTGNPRLLPYTVNDRSYMSVPDFQWQKLRPPLRYHNPQFEAMHNVWRADWDREQFGGTWTGFKVAFLSKLSVLGAFYAPPQLGMPIIAALFLFPRNKKVRFCFIASALFVAGLLGAFWFSAHYAAPFTVLVYVLIVFGLRSLRLWTFHARPVGVGLTRGLVTSHTGLLLLKMIGAGVFLHSVDPASGHWAQERSRFQTKLESMPGQHLVLVRYLPRHDPNQEWVYNRADIDRAKVVWAREIPGRDLQPLLKYFAGRDLWVVEPDTLRGPTIQAIASPDKLASADDVREPATASPPTPQ